MVMTQQATSGFCDPYFGSIPGRLSLYYMNVNGLQGNVFIRPEVNPGVFAQTGGYGF